MLKYSKGLGAGITFFALWVMMVPNGAPYMNLVGYSIPDSLLSSTYEREFEGYYYRKKAHCEKTIKYYKTKGEYHPNYKRRFYDSESDAKRANGFCVKASDL